MYAVNILVVRRRARHGSSVHGRNVTGTIVYEIRQVVIYLNRRPDVDPEKIGMTGVSFGGITTFSTWLESLSQETPLLSINDFLLF